MIKLNTLNICSSNYIFTLNLVKENTLIKFKFMRDEIFKIKVEDHVWIDRIIFGKLTEPAIDFFYNYGFIPNHLTTLSFIFQLLAVSNLIQGFKYSFSFFYFLGYYFDCIDGPMARKYNMVTKFGDWYDHFTDITCFILTNYIFVLKLHIYNYPLLVSAYITMFFGLIGYAGSQERIYNEGLEKKDISMTLYLTTIFIKSGEDGMKYLKPFCYTHFVLFTCLIPLFIS